ncbi:hypothetical protein CHRY9390_02825 [Chryseobacterium aquaeductus]|uniref:Lipoprotein n=1 Tax=Chryseobacterium aquaeductus TaxID=2675056 RepID=A0A9N8MHZ3_9FLAO|nr:hypothetical protein [Chryseobacterium aquaeductus]CAA7332104.1 hypothetical protein CHRY9390_02825 [Chryseobacterium potabilaquae]CAD7814559.1 hypothetical protein CHRY9390_02825 [Chryseobacterium aquaeductus]
MKGLKKILGMVAIIAFLASCVAPPHPGRRPVPPGHGKHMHKAKKHHPHNHGHHRGRH